MNWEAVIGLEIHVQLDTKSKIFSGAACAYGAEANVHACAIDLGLPGVLPVINEAAIRKAIMLGLAVGAEIAPHSVFARKNYFYPDLPKGYQISQFELPIVSGGQVEITLPDGASKTIHITRAHLEEDAGKSVHEGFGEFTGIDLNRAGTPLIEIVSEPEMNSALEAVAYMKKIHSLVRYLEISDGNMQEGSFRCDANVSVRREGDDTLGTRAEIKNINSFRFVEQAINFEIERQVERLEDGEPVIQETRLFDPHMHETRPMRSKEEANDYRYFPDPDLLPVEISPEEIEAIRIQLPELPDARRARFTRELGLSGYDSDTLCANKDMADYFEDVLASAPGQAKLCANWVMGELAAALNRENCEVTDAPVSAAMLAELVTRISDGTISSKIAKQVFDAMWAGEGRTDEVIEAKGLKQLTDSAEIEKLVATAIENNPEQVEQYRSSPADKRGKLIGFFVGQVMKASQGKANPQQVNQLLRDKLEP